MKIIVATGGTGGHIFPALQTACVLRERGHEVIFVGALEKAVEKVRDKGFQVVLINAKGLTNRSFLGVWEFSSSMMQAFNKSVQILKEAKPNKVIGFGGYGSFAVVLAACRLNIPTMIHEQNVVPGKANKLLAKMVKKIAISFPETKKYLDEKKSVWTGCPCHQSHSVVSKEELLKRFSLDPYRKTVLLLGGSQGSQKLNEVFFQWMSSSQRNSSLQAIHMTGIKEYDQYEARYGAETPVKVVDFLSPIEDAYKVADIVITRSGAATVSELGFFGIPSIFIPYPLADGHQKYNAEILSQLGLGQIIEQKDLTKDSLQKAVESILKSSFNRSEYLSRRKEFFKETPAVELAMALESL